MIVCLLLNLCLKATLEFKGEVVLEDGDTVIRSISLRTIPSS